MAAKKGEADIALGNVIGSNIFNILFIVGLSGVIVPLGLNQDVLMDMIILIGVTSFVVILGMTKSKISRFEGVIMLLIYVSYITFIILRALSIF